MPRSFNWLGNAALRFGNRLTSSNDANVQLTKNGWMGGGWLGGRFGGAPAAGIPVTQDSAMTVSTVYACTQASAETLASLPPMMRVSDFSSISRRERLNDILVDQNWNRRESTQMLLTEAVNGFSSNFC